MKYVAYKITAANVDDLCEKYKGWINAINQRSCSKATIVSTNIVQNETCYYMIITYSY